MFGRTVIPAGECSCFSACTDSSSDLWLSLVLGAQVAPLVDGSQAVTLPVSAVIMVLVMLYDNFQSYMSVAARDFLKPRKKAEMA